MADTGKVTIHITANISPSDVSTCNEIFDNIWWNAPYKAESEVEE